MTDRDHEPMTDRDGPLATLAGLAETAWLVGGALRDRLLGRPTADYDVVLEGDVRSIARQLAKAQAAHPFELSETFGAWRVVSRDRRWTVDLRSEEHTSE